MKKFNYTMNHRADEAYMDRMCREGWAAMRTCLGISYARLIRRLRENSSRA